MAVFAHGGFGCVVVVHARRAQAVGGLGVKAQVSDWVFKVIKVIKVIKGAQWH
jgi:hypothetical protein